MNLLGTASEPGCLDLYSPLPPEECVKRLKECIDQERFPSFSFTSLFGKNAIAGYVDSTSFRLRKRIAYRNSFQTFLKGIMKPEGTGTIIQGVFAPHGFTMAFMLVWFGGVAVIGGLVFVSSLFMLMVDPHSPKNPALGVIVPPAMLAFGFALVRFGRYLARDEAKFLAGAVRHILEAEDRKAAA